MSAPPATTTKQNPRMSQSVSLSPSISAVTRAPSRSSRGSARAAVIAAEKYSNISPTAATPAAASEPVGSSSALVSKPSSWSRVNACTQGPKRSRSLSGRPNSSARTQVGMVAEKSACRSTGAPSAAARAISWTRSRTNHRSRSSRRWTRRGVKPRPIRARRRVCTGGSSITIVGGSPSWPISSRKKVSPEAEEKISGRRTACQTSSKRDSAQNAGARWSPGWWCTGSWSRSRA